MRERLELGSDTAISRSLPLEPVQAITAAEDMEDVHRWAIDTVDERIDPDAVEIATRNEQLLVPVESSQGGTGREHARSIDTSIPGSALSSGDPCRVDDVNDVRGVAATEDDAEPGREFRSLLCAPIGAEGTITAFGRTPGQFDDVDLDCLATVGGIVSNMHELVDRADQGGVEPLLEEIGNMVSHDLRNKINIATGRLDLAIKTDEEEHLVRSVDALESVERIADVVVSLARTGEPLNGLETVALETAVENAFGPLGEPDTTLTIKATASILADPDCLAQLLENLFRNAIEHSDGPVTIEVGLLEDGFYVSDNGPGIPPDVREEVRELGYSTAPDHQGKGLAIVTRMTEAHGWSMDITESTSGGTRIEMHGVVFR